MEIDFWQRLAVLILAMLIAADPSQQSQARDGEINVTASIHRPLLRDCNHWSMYIDEDDETCENCMFVADVQRKITQDKCNSSGRMGSAIYSEHNPTRFPDSVPKCDIRPLQKPGVRATCTFNTIQYEGDSEPTPLPGALCQFYCAHGYTPSLDPVTYLECSKCTVKGELCQWNRTLEGSLCYAAPASPDIPAKPSTSVTGVGTAGATISVDVAGMPSTYDGGEAPAVQTDEFSPFIVPTTTLAPRMTKEIYTPIIVGAVSFLIVVLFIIAIYHRKCNCTKWPSCIRRYSSRQSQSNGDDVSNTGDPLFAGDKTDCIEHSVRVHGEGEPLKSVESGGGSESGYSSNSDKLLVPTSESGTQLTQHVQNVHNINNYFQQVNIDVNGDISKMTIEQPCNPIGLESKPSGISLQLAEKSSVAMDRMESSSVAMDRMESSSVAMDRMESSSVAMDRMASSSVAMDRMESSSVAMGQIELAKLNKTGVERKDSAASNAASINSTPICDHHLNGAGSEALSENISFVPAREVVTFSTDAVDEPTLTADDHTNSSSCDTPPVTILPKQGNFSEGLRANSRFLTKDSGIETANPDDLPSAELLPSSLPTPHLCQVAEEDDVVQLPANNLNTPLHSATVSSPASNPPTASEAVRHDFISKTRDVTSDLIGCNETLPDIPASSNYSSGKLVLDSNQNMLAVFADAEPTKCSSLDLEIQSMESVSLRHHGDGTSEEPPAPDADPRSLTLDVDDSLVFSNFDSCLTESGDGPAWPGTVLEHIMEKADVTSNELPKEINLQGPRLAQNSNGPHPLTENLRNQPYYQRLPYQILHQYGCMPPYLPHAQQAQQGYVYCQSDAEHAQLNNHAYMHPHYGSPPPYVDERSRTLHQPFAYANQYPPYRQSPIVQPGPRLQFQQPMMMYGHPMAAHRQDLPRGHYPPQGVNNLPPMDNDTRQRTNNQSNNTQPQEAYQQIPHINRQLPQQGHCPVNTGELLVKANRVDELIVERQRNIHGSSPDAHSLIRETSLYPQPGGVQVEADSVGRVESRYLDNIISNPSTES